MRYFASRRLSRSCGGRLVFASAIRYSRVAIRDHPSSIGALMLYRRRCCVLVAVALLSPLGLARAADSAFPFGTELMLDVEPLYGSKRIPMLQIEDNGTATIDLWCASVRAQATVGETSITIVAEPAEPAQCTPERQSGDETLLTALSQVTTWRRNGEVIELIGPTTLHYREMTN
jgi:hypothetical protein